MGAWIEIPENVSILDENVYILEENADTFRQSKVKENIYSSLSVTQPPGLEEVKRYVAENGIKTDAGRFYAFYAMKGWKDGCGNPIEDWKAALDYWLTFEKGRQGNKGKKSSRRMEEGRKKQYRQFGERDISEDEMEDLERALLGKG